jgi:menaquinone-dependent protoporphyrinogen oxidase
MPKPRALVLYASTHGHTATIASRITDVLVREGVDVTALRAGPAIEALPSDFDAAILVASVHRGRHAQAIVEYARHHHTSLSARPSALVSVSLSAAEHDDAARAATRELIDDLLDETGWIPDDTLAVAGALQFREYGVVTRLMMRVIAARHGAPVDTSRDHELTDWPAVDRFTSAFAATLIRPGAATAVDTITPSLG